MGNAFTINGWSNQEELGELLNRECVCLKRTSNQNEEKIGVKNGKSIKIYQFQYQQVAHNPVRTCVNCNGTHFRVNKSRYDPADSYISAKGEPYNDMPVTLNIDYYNEMVDAGVDLALALHVAHLFIRDPFTTY